MFADSRDVAERFGKRHDNVIRAIRNILDTDAEAVLNFEASAYKDSTGRPLIHYLMDRDGFMQLVMGFTGAEAIRWRRAFIAAFNAMEAELRKPAAPQPTLTREQRIAAALLESQEVIAERDRKIAELEPKAKALDVISQAEGDLSLTKAAINLGLRPGQVIKALEDRRHILRFGKKGADMRPSSDAVARGLLRWVSRGVFSGEVRHQTMVTPKGQTWLAKNKDRIAGLVD